MAPFAAPPTAAQQRTGQGTKASHSHPGAAFSATAAKKIFVKVL
jgi:hypothetical protein